jgi:hypothetical protein
MALSERAPDGALLRILPEDAIQAILLDDGPVVAAQEASRTKGFFD